MKKFLEIPRKIKQGNWCYIVSGTAVYRNYPNVLPNFAPKQKHRSHQI